MESNSREFVELHPQGEKGRIEYTSEGGGFTIDDVSPAFDIPVEEAVERFKEELDERAADRTWEYDYDGFDVFHHKAERAIEAVLDHGDPRIKTCAAPGAVAENIGPQAEQHYDGWETVADAWIGQWLMLYNGCLCMDIDESLDRLESALQEVASQERFSVGDVRVLVEHFLDEIENDDA